jgi:hypothetical protein
MRQEGKAAKLAVFFEVRIDTDMIRASKLALKSARIRS